MKYIRRTVGFEIVIKSSINAKGTRVNFSSDIKYGYNSNLLSYSYTESMQNIQGSFSLSAVYKSDDLDKIEVHDIVIIKEGTTNQKKTAFIGLIKNISYSQKMNDQGQVTSVINITGTNIFGIISTTKLVIDRAIIGNLCQNEAVTKFQNKLSEVVDKDKTLGDTINAFIKAFTDLKTENMQDSEYYNDIINSITVDAGDLKAKYQMALGYLGGQQCTLWQLISQVVPPPVYECFLTLDSGGTKYRLVVRECPFMAKTSLNEKELDDLYLKGSELHKKDNEVYSYYLTTIAGSGLNKNIIMFLNDGQDDAGNTSKENNADKQQSNVAHLDKDIMSRFGFRPLIVELGFFDNAQSQEIASQVSQTTSNALAETNKNNHKKLSGTIEALHDGEIWNVGTVIKSRGKAFYIEQIETRWNYGQAHTRRFYVTRGGSKVNTAS